jgi:TPR repeat protein
MKFVWPVIVLFCTFIFLLLPKASFAARIDELSSMAKQGQVEAQFTLAEAYYFGKGTGKNLKQALFWYEKAALQGHPKAQRALGAMYELGQGTANEPKKAAFWYQKSAEQGLARAQTNLGILYETGVGVEKNFETARLWYEKAAAQDNARGQTNLGRMYELGTGVEVDYTKAFYWYLKAAEQNYLRALTNLGALYENGQGIEQNYAVAIALYTKAAEQSYARAQFYLGRMFEHGLGVEKDVALASKWYSQAAVHGHVEAQEQLAKVKSGPAKTHEKTIREKQEAVDQVQDDEVTILTDVKEKENLKAEQIKSSHENLATAGDSDSQYFLGLLYLNGDDGYEMDAEKAAYWFSLAAEKGNIAAQYQLGLLYLKGKGVEENSPKGILLLKQAAKSGNVDAQCHLAVMYLDALGVEQDKEYAIFWLQKAISQGYRIAINALDSIIEKQAETTDNYNSKRAAVLYQLFIAEQQRRENDYQDIRISSNEMSEKTPDETHVTAVMNSITDNNKKDIHARVARLQLEIERLTERLESGLSDSDYERYKQLKSPVFVIHDSERLQAYQTELDKLLLEMKSQ